MEERIWHKSYAPGVEKTLNLCQTQCGYDMKKKEKYWFPLVLSEEYAIPARSEIAC